MTTGDTFYDADVAEDIFQAAERIPVDVEAEWALLCDRLERERDRRPAFLPRLLLVAAAIAAILFVARPVVVSGTLATFHYLREVAGVETTTTVQTTPRTVPTTTSTTLAITTTTAVPPTTTTPPPPTTSTLPPTTTTTVPVSAGHSELVNGTDFERAVRQVHIQLNEAIGYQRRDFGALQGSPELVESLLGQQSQFDARLRDVLGNLREAIRNNNYDAASLAHTIITGIEKDLGTAGRR